MHRMYMGGWYKLFLEDDLLVLLLFTVELHAELVQVDVALTRGQLFQPLRKGWLGEVKRD